MKACENHSDGIMVYSGRDCPLCQAQSKVDDLTDAVGDANDKIDDLTAKLGDANDKLEAL